MTYYRKSREERAEDYIRVAPKLAVFSQVQDVKAKIEDALKGMSKDELNGLLEFIKNGKSPCSKKLSRCWWSDKVY